DRSSQSETRPTVLRLTQPLELSSKIGVRVCGLRKSAVQFACNRSRIRQRQLQNVRVPHLHGGRRQQLHASPCASLRRLLLQSLDYENKKRPGPDALI